MGAQVTRRSCGQRDATRSATIDPVSGRASTNEAVRAAVDVATEAGWVDVEPVLLHDSNHVVVRLDPHPVVAKVDPYRSPERRGSLAREVAVAAHLTGTGAPVVAPLGPVRRSRSSLAVALWCRVAQLDRAVDPSDLATALRRVHDGLAWYPDPLPSYVEALDRPRAVLDDRQVMGRLPEADVDLLRTGLDRWAATLRDADRPQRALHGEPHEGNVLVTSDGPVLLDFEAACQGPLEWDVAHLPPAAAERYAEHHGDIDEHALAFARLLTSARIATWCWAGAEHPDLRRPGEHHLALVRAALA